MRWRSGTVRRWRNIVSACSNIHRKVATLFTYRDTIVSTLDFAALFVTFVTMRAHATDDRLTREQIERFHQEGYHLSPGLLSAEESAELRAELLGILQACKDDRRFYRPDGSWRCDPIELETVPPENPHSVWLVFEPERVSEKMFRALSHPKVVLMADELIGPDLNLYDSAAIIKSPGFPAGFRGWHQDSHYYIEGLPDPRNLTTIIYLDDMDRNSGASGVVPGTHRDPMYPHHAPAPDRHSGHAELIDQASMDGRGLIPEFKAGDVLFFYTHMVHKAGGNQSGRTRCNLIFNYVNAEMRGLKKPTDIAHALMPITRDGRVVEQTRSTEN